MTENNNVLQKIKQLMDERHWSLYRLAQESKLPYSSLNSMFAKNTHPTLPTLEHICKGFNITLSEFFESEECKPEPHEIKYSNDEINLINYFRNTPPSHQRLLLAYLEGLSNSLKK